MSKRRIGVAVAVVVLAAAGGLALTATGEEEANSGAGVGLANPASAFCEEQGGTVEFVAEAGGSRGLCHLPDGSVVDEWEYWRRLHDRIEKQASIWSPVAVRGADRLQ